MLAGPFGGAGLQSGVCRLSRTSRRASRVRFDSYFFLKKKKRERRLLAFTLEKFGHVTFYMGLGGPGGIYGEYSASL